MKLYLLLILWSICALIICVISANYNLCHFLLLQAFLVFILYVRCTAINPADPGIMLKFDGRLTQKSNPNNSLSENLPGRFEEDGAGNISSPSSASRSTKLANNSSLRGSKEGSQKIDIAAEPVSRKSYCSFGGIFCGIFVHEDCRKQDALGGQQGGAEDALFCTLCNAEVSKC